MRVTIEQALELIWSGGVVAFPTETVYGLGASALDAGAVAKVFDIKGRPNHNPLIVHVSSVEMARSLVAGAWPDRAHLLAATFWPGPLTLVVPKGPMIPGVVTGDGHTVAVRMPDHPVALDLIDRAGTPVVGPSANPSTRISPTRAEHVEQDYNEAVPVLDGGPCARGIESTVIDATAEPPRILRAGVVGAPELTKALSTEVLLDTGTSTPTTKPARSPGTQSTHYAPTRAVLHLHDHAALDRVIEEDSGSTIYLTDRVVSGVDANRVLTLPSDAGELEPMWYDTLRRADELAGAHHTGEIHLFIDLEALPPHVRDRIVRAASMVH
ncbi:MAG: L-threonylcarbamoyladenylate synthase [Planctomycetota bacterium]